MVEDKDKEILLKKASRVLDNIKKARKIVVNHRSSYFSTIGRTKTIQSILMQGEEVLKLIEGKSITLSNLVNDNSSMDEASANLLYAQETLQDAFDKLESKVKPQLSLNEKQELVGFREDLEKLNKEVLGDIIYRDLERAIAELEIPNYISSSMLSARASVYMIDKIKGDGENKDTDKVKKLQEIGVIEKDEMSNTTSKYFLDASRSSRNLLLHQIGVIPSPTDANGYLSTAIKMARIYVGYMEKKKP